MVLITIRGVRLRPLAVLAAWLMAVVRVGAGSFESGTFTVDTRVPRLDSDGDGLPDAYERAVGLDPMAADTDADADGDGRTNIEEYNAGTDPHSRDINEVAAAGSALFVANTGGLSISAGLDSDGDGMPDWWEIRHRLNPFVRDGFADADGDEQTNLSEFLKGLDPNNDERASPDAASGLFEADTGGRYADTDGDGLPNWWERLYFDTSTAGTRLGNPDGDGHNNYEEFLAGTNPTDSNSVLRLLDLRVWTPGNGILRWSSVRGRTYSLWRSQGVERPFVAVATNLEATPPVNSYTNRVSAAAGFYRVSATPN